MTQASGYYSILSATSGSYTVTPGLAGYIFSPSSRQTTVSGADVTGQDFAATSVFTISGTLYCGGDVVRGHWVTLQPGNVKVFSNSFGIYQFQNQVSGSYTVTPDPLAGYGWSPPSRSVTVNGSDVGGQDFTATPATYTVFGTVTQSGSGLAGVTMTLAPGGNNATTQANGTYAIVGVANGSYTLTPSKSGYTFTPPNRSVTVSGADVTNQDFIATPVQTGLGNTPWPKFHGNAKNTGLSPNVGAQTNHVKWSHMGSGNGSSPAVGADGTVYVGGYTYNVYALDPSDGSVKWSYLTGNRLISAPAVSADGTVYIGSEDCKVYALNLADGSLKWSHDIGIYVDGSPAIGADGTIFVGSGNTVYALNPTDGSVKWSHATANAVQGSPAIGADGTVYVGSMDRNVYALNPANGSIVWTAPTCPPGNVGVFGSVAIGSDGTLYVGSGGSVYALNSFDGSQKWVYPTGGEVDSSPAIGADGTIYVGSQDGNVYALFPSTGNVKWSHSTDGSVISSPAIGADGTVYVGSFDGSGGTRHFYALNASDGSVKWSYSVSWGFQTSSPAIAGDGTIYVGCCDGKLYAFGP